MAEKILVIDDEPLILNTIERALSKTGYVIKKAKDMNELNAVLKYAPFDMLIVDLYLEKDSAETLIEKVKMTSPLVKILKISGLIKTKESKNFLEKPFKIDELRKRVRDILNEPS